jgi:serine/threonine protein kinase
MSLLTTEPCNANVVAETDMVVWRVYNDKVMECYRKYSDLREFLTDLVTSRYSEVMYTADRSIGKYTIQELLGQGAWSIVYKGIHDELNMPVTIKMLKHNLALDYERVETFEREAKITAQLNHENIVRIYDIEERYKTTFLIMEFLDGLTLGELLPRVKRLPLPKALDILIQFCEGLGFAHEHGIIHQDVKPDNIFLHHDVVKIFDFGMAKTPGIRDESLPGTAHYMAPEQITGEPIDERTDIYSTGITAYELVTGVKPFAHDDAGEIFKAQLEQIFPDPRLLVPELPVEFFNILLSATQKDPGRRYKSIWEMQFDLRQLAAKIGIQDQLAALKKPQVKGFFISYQPGQLKRIDRLVDDFSYNMAKVGASLRIIEFGDN